jgi:hypothetical protein
MGPRNFSCNVDHLFVQVFDDLDLRFADFLSEHIIILNQ